jgi:hypothetical protein
MEGIPGSVRDIAIYFNPQPDCAGDFYFVGRVVDSKVLMGRLSCRYHLARIGVSMAGHPGGYGRSSSARGNDRDMSVQITRCERDGWSIQTSYGPEKKRTEGPQGALACTYPSPSRRAFPSVTSSRVSERKRDELGPVARLHPHQHGVLAGLVEVRDLLADIRRTGDRLAGDIEDDVNHGVAVTAVDPNGPAETLSATTDFTVSVGMSNPMPTAPRTARRSRY